ncbi:hypothetical protein COR50_10890 [Chitinophaga caeni]|uniref:Uncharacterized protein n=1 Tax=Chitinophaga caeni TaxID=2029983 RepID=A0A291QUC0_9BACT|nr:hypothetical protein [Chitinophaga caeni]ATL47629.1 hypothetical protein COR50_10890 [Chitinophaga caeni]
MRYILVFFLSFYCLQSAAQDTASYRGMIVNLDEFTVKAKRLGFDVNSFIKRVEDDTTFYQAFKHLRRVSFDADNNIRITSKKGADQASLVSKTRQHYANNCRSMEVLEEKTTGDFYNRKKEYNYYTAELYANLFFTKGVVCNDDELSPKSRSSIEKHKGQLKQLIFNPGKPIKGVPIVGHKVAIFSDGIRQWYDFSIKQEAYLGTTCYVFSAVVKPGLNKINKAEVVINELTTYFDKDNYEIVGRKYSLSYKTLIFDFDVSMVVQMTHVGDLLVPSLITYDGTWNVPFKKRETAKFKARFHHFSVTD